MLTALDNWLLHDHDDQCSCDMLRVSTAPCEGALSGHYTLSHVRDPTWCFSVLRQQNAAMDVCVTRDPVRMEVHAHLCTSFKDKGRSTHGRVRRCGKSVVAWPSRHMWQHQSMCAQLRSPFKVQEV